MKNKTNFKIPFTSKVLVVDDSLAYPIVIIILPVLTCLSFVYFLGMQGALIATLLLVCYTVWKEKMISISNDDNK